MDRSYGWVRDSLDHRDIAYMVEAPAALPPKVDLRPKMPPVFDQGNLGSCTANAIAGAISYEHLLKDKKAYFTPSRLFIYYNERRMEGTTKSDSGAQIRDGVKSVNIDGVCSEQEWPYIIEKFTKRPSLKCYAKAKLQRTVKYNWLDNVNINQLKTCLAVGDTFVFGFMVTESFESAAVAKTGKMPIPKPTERVLGGHAVMAVGYDDAKKVFIVRNSWGTQWGAKGYFYMPYDFIVSEDWCADFWAIKTINF